MFDKLCVVGPTAIKGFVVGYGCLPREVLHGMELKGQYVCSEYTTSWQQLCRYNAFTVLNNIHKRHPIARAMGCCLWVNHLIDILLQSLQSYIQFLTILDRVIIVFVMLRLVWGQMCKIQPTIESVVSESLDSISTICRNPGNNSHTIPNALHKDIERLHLCKRGLPEYFAKNYSSFEM